MSFPKTPVKHGDEFAVSVSTDPAPLPPLVEPRQRDWDETPREAAAFDDQYWDIDCDYDTEPDDPSDHYYY